MTIYRCVGGVNREIKQQFRGVGGVNKEVKEQYRGVSGVNRKLFSGEPQFPTLYDNGKENTSICGGFGITPDTSYCSPRVTSMATKYDNYLYFYGYYGNVYGCNVITPLNKIDFTNYSKINLDVVTSRRDGAMGFMLSNHRSNFVENYTKFQDVVTNNVRKIVSIDISNVTSMQYLYLYSLDYSDRYGSVYKIWLE